jgi:hypothetical protein
MQVVHAVVAAAMGLPGLLLGWLPRLGHGIWRVISYRFPVALGAYVCAAVAIRFLVERVEGLWSKNPVRDLCLDGDDQSFVKYGGIIPREAQLFLTCAPTAPSASASPPSRGTASKPQSCSSYDAAAALLRAGLELAYRPGRRDEYLRRLTLVARALGGDEAAQALGPLNLQLAPTAMPVMQLGRMVLYVRLADALARLSRDSLVASARRVQAVLRYWTARFRPGTGTGNKARGRGRGRGRGLGRGKDDSQRLLELEALLNDHIERTGALQAHLLRRPGMDQSGEAVLRWVMEAVRLSERAMQVVTVPAGAAAESGRRVGDLLPKWLRQGGGWLRGVFPHSKSQGQSESEAPPEEVRAPEPEVPVVEAPVTETPRPQPPVTLQDLPQRGNDTLVEALHLKGKVAVYLDRQGLDRPKLNALVKLGLKTAAYLVLFRLMHEVWSQKEWISSSAGKVVVA